MVTFFDSIFVSKEKHESGSAIYLYTKGCLSLFNSFIDKNPTLMSPFIVKKHVFEGKNNFFQQNMDSLGWGSCL